MTALPAHVLTPDFIAGRLAAHSPRVFHENPEPGANRSPAPAAVLVGLVEHAEGLSILLTQRTDHLDHHPGQISFPGGRMESADATPEAAALRETHEEIGAPAEYVRIIGRLDDYITGTGFRVTPVVGVLRPDYPFNPDPFEVAEAFEAPLAFFMDPANHERRVMKVRGRARTFYAMPYQERLVWGATAGMLRNFYEILAGARAAPPPAAEK
ncbi:MAG: CoA pyrophosphatase [Rhodospirillales bacterium]